MVVIGAGIAGLASGYLVRELGREAGIAVDLTILEAADKPGGATRTTIGEGYTCEWGPNGFLDNEPATLRLVERLGLSSELVGADPSAANRYIYHHGKMRLVPMKPPQFLTSDILPLSAKLRMLCELIIPAKRDGEDETIDNFGRRRLGNQFAQYLLDPMISGIFAGDTTRMSLKAAFPKMVQMETEHGGLFRAMLAKRREKSGGGPGGPSGMLKTFRTGMGRLTGKLAEELGECVVTSSPVTEIVVNESGYRVIAGDRIVEADVVIVAAPSFAAAGMVEGIDPQVAEAIAGIKYAPVDVVCHGHRLEDFAQPINGFGVLIPRSEKIRSLGTLWSDCIFPGQAPQGYRLLRTIIGGAHDRSVRNLRRKRLNRIAEADHRRVQGVTASPSFQRIFRHPKGIAQYNVGHCDRVAKTEELERRLPGLFFTGASYRGVSVNGCAKDAFRVAEGVLKLTGRKA